MNIAKLNTVSLDDKTFIIKRGTSGGATINNQNKVVDITENGTTEITPDSNFTGLSKVTANVNVSGGSGGELEGEYYLARPNGWYWKVLSATSTNIKVGTADYELYGAFVVLLCSTNSIYSSKPFYSSVVNDIKDVVDANVGINDEFYRRNEQLDYLIPVIAFAEMPIRRMMGNPIQADSIYELFKMETGEISEADFLGLMETELGLQRITKEEYDAMTNKTE